jgi:hypothetical protein
MKDSTGRDITEIDPAMINEALEHARTLESLIDGDTEDELGTCLEPIREYLLKIGTFQKDKIPKTQVD